MTQPDSADPNERLSRFVMPPPVSHTARLEAHPSAATEAPQALLFVLGVFAFLEVLGALAARFVFDEPGGFGIVFVLALCVAIARGSNGARQFFIVTRSLGCVCLAVWVAFDPELTRGQAVLLALPLPFWVYVIWFLARDPRVVRFFEAQKTRSSR